MRLQGTISTSTTGLTGTLAAMHLDMQLMSIGSGNISGYDKVGFQKRTPVVSSFAEYLGIHGVSTSLDDSVGRIAITEAPLDIALSQKGYLQMQREDGSVELSRDGRLHLSADGELLGSQNHKILSSGGSAIVFPFAPERLEDIKISREGNISVFDPNSKLMVNVGQIGVVSTDGKMVTGDCVEQAHLEFSNVSLQEEVMNLVPIKKNFDANRQMFLLQNSKLSSAIQQLGNG